MKIISVSVVSSLALALAACGGEPVLLSGDEAAQLETHQNKWEAHGIDSYEVDYWGGGTAFGGPPLTQLKVLSVSDGMISKAVVKETGAEIAEEKFDEYPNYILTIDEAFLLVDSLIKERPHKLTVEYNEEFGFPESIYVDYRLMTHDEEKSWNFTAFTPDP